MDGDMRQGASLPNLARAPHDPEQSLVMGTPGLQAQARVNALLWTAMPISAPIRSPIARSRRIPPPMRQQNRKYRAKYKILLHCLARKGVFLLHA